MRTGFALRAAACRSMILAVVAVAVLLAAPAAGAKTPNLDPSKVNPVIFVHGGAGSGAQFESQQMRLTSNGFPQRYIYVLEYDTLTPIAQNIDEVHASLDALIEKVKAKTGKSQVDVLGHSRGTTVMHGYLASAARAANVRRYVNIDGRTADSPPGGVPTLAIWAGRGEPGRSIGGAENVTVPNQTHVQVATSAESFAPIFRFLIGKNANTTEITKGKRKVKVAGRAVVFPQNTGMENTELQVWRIEKGSGQREGRRPAAKPELAEDGSWGPIRLRRGQRYEFALLRSGGATHHIYPEPFRRDDRLVRLLSSVPGGGIEALIADRPDNASGLLVLRYKEFWGDQGAQSDVLKINGQNILNPATSPIEKRTNGIFVLDAGSDGVSDLSTPVQPFFSLPFLTGVDLFLPAASPPNGKVTVGLRSRGSGPVRRLNFPNFPSSTDLVSVVFNDYE